MQVKRIYAWDFGDGDILSMMNCDNGELLVAFRTEDSVNREDIKEIVELQIDFLDGEIEIDEGVWLCGETYEHTKEVIEILTRCMNIEIDNHWRLCKFAIA